MLASSFVSTIPFDRMANWASDAVSSPSPSRSKSAKDSRMLAGEAIFLQKERAGHFNREWVSLKVILG